MSETKIKVGAAETSLPAMAKDVLMTAVIALVLAVPFIGLKSDSVGTALELYTRWPEMFAIIGAVLV